MEEKIIVKYENNKPVYMDVNAPPQKGPGGFNGCVNGTPCKTCHWHKWDDKCPTKIYCVKLSASPCP
jgi:hypothetical protein